MSAVPTTFEELREVVAQHELMIGVLIAALSEHDPDLVQKVRNTFVNIQITGETTEVVERVVRRAEATLQRWGLD